MQLVCNNESSSLKTPVEALLLTARSCRRIPAVNQALIQPLNREPWKRKGKRKIKGREQKREREKERARKKQRDRERNGKGKVKEREAAVGFMA